jgi:isopenicillin-N N-acyltransferase like protein
MIGLLGVNAAGVACCVNTLNALPSGRSGMPVAFLVRGVLSRRDAASAAAYLTSVPHASGQHFAVADPSGLRGFECAAAGCAPGPATDRLLHTNHPLWWTGPVEEAPAAGKHVVTTHVRLRALRDGLDRVRRSGDVSTLLSSTGSGLCVLPTPERRSATFCSAEFTLASPPRVRIALGRPDREPWRTVEWRGSNVA